MEEYRRGKLAALISKCNSISCNVQNEAKSLDNSRGVVSKTVPYCSDNKTRDGNPSHMGKETVKIRKKRQVFGIKSNESNNIKTLGKHSTSLEISLEKKRQKMDGAASNIISDKTMKNQPDKMGKNKKLKHTSESKDNSVVHKENASNSINFISNNKPGCEIGKKKTKSCNSETTEAKKDFTVYVGNLPLTYDHKKVVKLFSKFGPIASARIRCVPVADLKYSKKRCAITKEFHPNRTSAVAYVVFKSKESVLKAVAENGMIIDGHHLRIDFAESEKRDTNKSIFVGNLPFDIEDDELWNFFKDCGEIESVRIVRDGNSSMGKGFGYVNFKSSASVELALHLDQQQLKNRTVNVKRWSQPKKKKKKLQGNQNETNAFSRKNKGGKNKSRNDSNIHNFQGTRAEQKEKKKKFKPSKAAIRQKKIQLLLNPVSKKNKIK